MSLYEDLVAAWVPAKHEWLRQRPLGEELVTRLGNHKMFSYCACMLIVTGCIIMLVVVLSLIILALFMLPGSLLFILALDKYMSN